MPTKRTPADQQTHATLIEELVGVLAHEGFTVSAADGVAGYAAPYELSNDGYGDQEDKAPDVYAYDPARKCYIIGEAKTGNGDLESNHALTQWNVFLDQSNSRSGAPSVLYVILPSSKVPLFQGLITHYIHREYWHRVVVVSSSRVSGQA
ncbi:MAG: hypothetical protein MUE68_01055 [Bacteroidetes bacterium]|jgi:hypothetical protein|nr:hypothetical protein [Bacteroidota bacterium]